MICCARGVSAFAWFRVLRRWLFESRPAWALGSLVLLSCASSAYVEAEAPIGVAAYPRVYDRGYVYYWGGDHWYVQRDGAWFYYRSEPAFLYRQRRHWYGPAPYRHRPYYDGPRYAPHRHVAPPARRLAPPARRSAPPSFRRH